MTTPVSTLGHSLEGLQLSTPVPEFASADIQNKPLDIIRSYLCEILCSLTQSEPKAAFDSIQLSNDPLHGDLTVVLPKLCPGSKAAELANDIITKVHHLLQFSLTNQSIAFI
jgi:arginyl-tRNA synthetase